MNFTNKGRCFAVEFYEVGKQNTHHRNNMWWRSHLHCLQPTPKPKSLTQVWSTQHSTSLRVFLCSPWLETRHFYFLGESIMIKLLVSFQLNIFKIKMHLQIAYFESYFLLNLKLLIFQMTTKISIISKKLYF